MILKQIKIKGIIIFFTLPLILMSCNNSTQVEKVSKLEQQNDSLAMILENRDSVMNEMIEAFFQIETDLAFIKESRNLISLTSDNLEIEKSQKEQIVQDVKQLATLLQENKKSLAALNKKLKNSGVKIKNLETRVTELTNSVDDRNKELISLKNELEQKDYEVSILNEQIAALENEKEEQDMVITDQQLAINKLNKAYYTSGTLKELLERGVVTKEGGFLGLGKTTLLNSKISKDYFSEIDVRNTKKIDVNADEVLLISEHPEGSYEFVKEENKIAYLAINDINEFYKLSKFIVIEVK